MIITSVQNTQVKNWSKLKMKKCRLKMDLFLIEGEHLLIEAHESDWEIQEIIVQDGTSVPDYADEYAITTVSDNVFQHITDTRTPQGVAAVVKIKGQIWPCANSVLLIDSVQDPGNIGTMIRTADAVGFDAIIIGNDSVDLYNEKVIRSTQGSLFHIPIFQADLTTAIPSLQKQDFTIWVTTLEQAQSYKDVSIDDKVALLVGNEGNGVEETLIDLADCKVKIPILGKAESLNVSVAAGILMYHIKG